MINAQRKGDEKACNCRNSKCIKLYCECFAARIPCGSSCHCLDCHNTLLPEHSRNTLMASKRLQREDSMKGGKGCACRKSGCTKKYCECYQLGILCGQYCKCLDCQNNESMVNKKAVTLLRNNSEGSRVEPCDTLYPLYISQNQRQMDSIIRQNDPLRLGHTWLEDCAKTLLQHAHSGGKEKIVEGMISIIEDLSKTTASKHLSGEELSLPMEEDQLSNNSSFMDEEQMPGSQDDEMGEGQGDEEKEEQILQNMEQQSNEVNKERELQEKAGSDNIVAQNNGQDKLEKQGLEE